MYCTIGKQIVEEEQQEKERTDYGTCFIRYLSEQLQPKYDSGFSYRQLNWYRQFYRTFPIVSTLWTQLSWSQYKLLLAIDNQTKREFYIAETVKNNWTVRQLERQINSSLYESLLMSSDKSVLVSIDKEKSIKNKANVFQWLCLSFCGLSGFTIEELILILTFFKAIKYFEIFRLLNNSNKL
ncbi:uncharacterized protein DUF1016 [Flavobacterium aquicola]|uniref:Uncharacterized protein DUF1016 n=2 Tax=Flavobacterium aquicola TaxID=1682742 RepID=A0A3E0EP01_9FLAO|nr:uncharacterized protein DUF1016 [Flavobacterium aquicola]